MLASKRPSEKLSGDEQSSKRVKTTRETDDVICDGHVKVEDSTAKSKSKKKNETILINPELEENVEVNVTKRAQLNTPSHLVRVFKSERFELHSPDMFSSTNCGQVPHVTVDLCDREVNGDVSVVSLHAVITHPGISTLEKLGKTLSQYMATSNKILLTPYDSSEPYDLRNFNDQLSVSVWGKGGRKRVTCKEYMAFVKVCSPELFVCLSDTVPASVNKKRANKSCYRTLNWVNETITFLAENSGGHVTSDTGHVTSDTGHVTSDTGHVTPLCMTSQVLAPIPGSGHRQLMMKSAKILANRNVYGYVIERATLPISGWEELVRDVISILPDTRPVVMLGVLNELELVQAYNCGCHFVDSSFALHYSNNGQAMTLDVSNPIKLPEEGSTVSPAQTKLSSEFGPSLSENAKQIPDEDNTRKNPKKPKDTGRTNIFNFTNYLPRDNITLNLTSPSYSIQFCPLQDACSCFTCTRHTRGYVNHLLVTRELLAPTLLMLHNLFHIRELVKEVKRSLVGSGSVDRLAELYKEVFKSSENRGDDIV